MKKFTFILCLAVAGTLFTACGDGNGSPSVSEAETSAEESATETEVSEEVADDEENYNTGRLTT